MLLFRGPEKQVYDFGLFLTQLILYYVHSHSENNVHHVNIKVDIPGQSKIIT
jgi:hypothetical protein